MGKANHNPCVYAPPGTEGTAHGAPSIFEVAVSSGTGTGVDRYTVCAEHLMPCIVWCYGEQEPHAVAVAVAPIYMSWPQDWARLLNDRIPHAFVPWHFDAKRCGAEDRLNPGDYCKQPESDHVPVAAATAPRAVQQLERVEGNVDPERAHAEADELLLSLVPREVREAYERLATRSRWWAGA